MMCVQFFLPTQLACKSIWNAIYSNMWWCIFIWVVLDLSMNWFHDNWLQNFRFPRSRHMCWEGSGKCASAAMKSFRGSRAIGIYFDTTFCPKVCLCRVFTKKEGKSVNLRGEAFPLSATAISKPLRLADPQIIRVTSTLIVGNIDCDIHPSTFATTFLSTFLCPVLLIFLNVGWLWGIHSFPTKATSTEWILNQECHRRQWWSKWRKMNYPMSNLLYLKSSNLL